jgi:transcriptional regulator with XRE-family HTH domain
MPLDLTPSTPDVKQSSHDWLVVKGWPSTQATGDEYSDPLTLGSYIDTLKIISLFGPWATGDEYGGVFVTSKVRLAGLREHAAEPPDTLHPPAEQSPAESVQSRAATIARAVPAVPVERPPVPHLTGELLDDARIVTGLTLDQIARAVRVSGRAVAAWRAGTVPSHRVSFLQAIRSIGVSLVGGLGPSGVQRWLLAGTPSRLDRLAAGDVDGVVAEARAYETSPAT